jgi:hypothetical protein
MNENENATIIYATDKNRNALSRQCVAGELTRITRGVYADTVWYDSLDRRARYIELIRICCQRHPEIVVAGRSAAILHGLDILSTPEYPAKVDVIIADWNKRSQSDIMQRYSGDTNSTNHTNNIYETFSARNKRELARKLSPAAVSDFTGIKIQALADALFFIMRHNSEADAIIALHSALRRCSDRAAFVIKKSKQYAFPLYSQEAFDLCAELEKRILKNEGVPGIRQARRILYLATDGAESPGESLTILYCYHFGLALPMINPTLLDSDGLFLGRVDLLWNCGGARIERRFHTDVMNGRYCRVLQGHVKNGDTVIVEFDGKIKYLNEDIRAGKSAEEIIVKEKDRENEIRRFGHAVLRMTWDEFYTPDLLYKKLVSGGVPARRYIHKKFDVLI